MEYGKPMKIKFLDNTVEVKQDKKEESKIESLAQDLDLPFNVVE